MHRRALLRGVIAAGAAAPLGGLLVPAGAGAEETGAAAVNFRVAITDVAANKIRVLDRTANFDTGRVHWSFSPGKSAGWAEMMEVRFRQIPTYGWVALVASRKGKAAMINVKKDKPAAGLGDVIWSVNAGPHNHGIEYLPGTGAVVVAASRSDKLTLYAPKAGQGPKTLAYVHSYKHVDAHTVWWDPDYKVLWAYGGTKLSSYRVTGSGRGTRLVKWKNDVTVKTNGHDLHQDQADKGKLTLTNSGTVMHFDKASRTYVKFPGAIGELNGVNSFVRHSSGQLMWTQKRAENPKDPHWWASPTVRFSAGGNRTRKGARIYRARIVPNFMD
ncbi:DUF6528 family protein [Phytomonospora endophytica]|uniref:Uncharacterized protein n=1 Tax=Phytomonospora endophytica TaxID=714109 RepID=A0A841FT63_9ACTN|nr:DUF6528 family protein [Phytomonospora endophytica]MBB6036732.1 hypothetical protein [Phytomonospora endophytica]GIG68234.1 hypothetical protein Pen01_45290 [Phytomonospora endophytica]